MDATKEELLNEVKNELFDVSRTNYSHSPPYKDKIVVDWKKIEQVIDQLKSDE